MKGQRTVKTILFALLVTCMGLGAQPPPASPPPIPVVPPDTNASPAVDTNRDELLLQKLHQTIAQSNNPAPTRNRRRPVVTAKATNAPAAMSLLEAPQPELRAAPPTTGPATSSAAPLGTAPAGPAPLPTPPGAAAAVTPPAPAPVNPPGNVPAASAPAAAAPAPNEEIIPPGIIDFRQADIAQVLQIYAEMVNRTILRAASLPAAPIFLKTQTPLTKSEAIQALDAVLALNGIAMI